MAPHLIPEEKNLLTHLIGLPRWLSGKESPCQAGNLRWIPGSGRSPGEGNGNPLHYSCLENSMNRGAWWATVRGVTNSDTTEQLPHFHRTDQLYDFAFLNL